MESMWMAMAQQIRRIFFAVATETFFEKPHQLLKQHPAL